MEWISSSRGENQAAIIWLVRQHQKSYLTGHCRYLRVKLLQKKLQLQVRICSWLVQDTETEDEEKPVKLSCRNSRKTEVMNTLGEFAQYREKEDNTFVAIVQVKDNEKFFGWLAGMGRDVVIAKPKKVVQAYRDYLKSILKEYK